MVISWLNFFLYFNLVDSYTAFMDETYRQQLLKSLYEQAQKENAPGYSEKMMELQTLANPERGFLGTDNTWHKPFQTAQTVNETEMNAVNKASLATKGTTFDKLSEQDKLKMLMSLQQINPPVVID